MLTCPMIVSEVVRLQQEKSCTHSVHSRTMSSSQAQESSHKVKNNAIQPQFKI